MACGSCQAHRDKIKQAAKSGSVTQTAVALLNAGKALGEDVGRKLIRTASNSKNVADKGR